MIEVIQLSARTLARTADVTLPTARRWKNAGRIPKAYEKLLQLMLLGDLGAVAPGWDGFRISSGQLWTPENDALQPGHIRAIPYREELIRELQRQLAQPQQWTLL